MKRMKLVAMMAAIVMLLSACNAVNITEVCSVGDEIMKKPEFMYYLQTGKSQAMTEAQNQGLTLSTDKDWETVMIDGVSANQYAKEKALESIKTIMVMEAKGKAAGFEITETDAAEVTSQKDQLIQQLGGRYAYEQALGEMGIDVTALDGIIERSVYANAYLTSISEGEDFMKPSEEEIQAKYNEDYVYIRHILISNQPPQEAVPENVEMPIEEAPIEEGPLDAEPVEEAAPAEEVAPIEAEPVDYDAEAKKEAEEILAKLAAGGDFIALMNEHSDDGRDENGKLSSDGYIMTDNGQMVPEFEEAAMKLEIGKYTTELVATDYGYHILMRYELPKQGENYDSTIATITSELTSDKLKEQINVWAEEVGFVLNQKFFDKLKIEAK